MEIKGKAVLITGASGSLGQIVVPAFVSASASVILGDLNPIQLRGVPWLKADFTDQTQVPGLVNEVIHTSGSIDALINLVGGFAMGRVVETDVSLWQRMLARNLTLMNSFQTLRATLAKPLRSMGC
jgi:NAD(P)-dependent dehydrogenase (short-subunit alcohol dehydrogenase family)